MKPKSAFIIFVIITDLALLASFFIFAKFDRRENGEHLELNEKLAENLKDLCDSESCLRFCKNLTSDQKEDFYKFVINSKADGKNEVFGDPCDEMEIFDIQQWNVTITMVREMSSCVHENARANEKHFMCFFTRLNCVFLFSFSHDLRRAEKSSL